MNLWFVASVLQTVFISNLFQLVPEQKKETDRKDSGI